jgi:octaprenyl-diphosphate synthase
MSPEQLLKQLKETTSGEMESVNRLIHENLQTQVPLVSELSHYIVNSGGKRLRPMLSVLAARACGYSGTQHHLLAAIIEFIHTATLLHDDVVDESLLRRGVPTANAEFGDHASVLVGDFLYSRAFQLLVKVGEMRIMDIMADTTNVISEGEVLQLVNCNDPDTTEESYIQVIDCKTAKLFEAACLSGSVIANTPQFDESVAKYGMYLGRAYQLMDDVLDYTASAEDMGKNLGDDLAEGKPTLPLIYAMREGSPQERAIIRDAILNGGLDKLDQILDIINSTGALAYTKERALDASKLAIDSLAPLPESEWRDAMANLATFSVVRQH